MSDMHDPYDDQLAAARYRAERDQARQECERLQRKAECLEDDIENLKLELGEANDRLRDSVPRDAYEGRRTKWLRQIRECETALHKRREYIKKLENAALERRTVRAEDREAAERGALTGGLGYLVAPLVGPWDACDGFRPVGYRPRRSGEFVNARKFELLDRSGLFDEMEAVGE